jgi:hypothetical protein
LLLLISSGKGGGRFRKLKLEARDRFKGDGVPVLLGVGRFWREGGSGNSVGLSKNEEVRECCGLGTVAVAVAVDIAVVVVLVDDPVPLLLIDARSDNRL